VEVGNRKHRGHSRTAGNEAELAEVVTGADAADLDVSASHTRIALEDQIHVSVIIALGENEGPFLKLGVLEGVREECASVVPECAQKWGVVDLHRLIFMDFAGPDKGGGQEVSRTKPAELTVSAPRLMICPCWVVDFAADSCA
jgi:hypothetical protein